MFKLQVLIIPQSVVSGTDSPVGATTPLLESEGIAANGTTSDALIPSGGKQGAALNDSMNQVLKNAHNMALYRQYSASPLPDTSTMFMNNSQFIHPSSNSSFMFNNPYASVSFGKQFNQTNNNKVKKFLHITAVSNTLEAVAYEINQRFMRLYPSEEPLQILKIQNSEECDLDPDYTVSMVFDTSNVCRVIVANEFSNPDVSVLLNNNGKRQLTGDLNRVMKKVRKGKNNHLSSNHPANSSFINNSIWSFAEDGDLSSNKIQHHNKQNMNKPIGMTQNSDNPNLSLAIPDVDDTVIHPSKRENLKLASPIIATGSPTRITSGMLNSQSQPNLSKVDYEEDIDGSMYYEQSPARSSVPSKEEALKTKTKATTGKQSKTASKSASKKKENDQFLGDISNMAEDTDISNASINLKTPDAKQRRANLPPASLAVTGGNANKRQKIVNSSPIINSTPLARKNDNKEDFNETDAVAPPALLNKDAQNDNNSNKNVSEKEITTAAPASNTNIQKEVEDARAKALKDLQVRLQNENGAKENETASKPDQIINDANAENSKKIKKADTTPANQSEKEAKKALEKAKKEELEAAKAKKKAEQEAKKAEKAALDAKKKAEQEAKKAEKAAQDAKKKAEQEAKKAEKAALDAKKKAEQEAKKAELELKKKAEQEAKKAELELKKKAEQDAKNAEQEAKKAELEAKQAEEKAKKDAADAKAVAELEAKKKAEAEAREKAEAETKKAELEANKKAAAEAKKAAAEAKKAEERAKKAELDAKKKAEAEAKKAEEKAKKAELAAKKKAEAEAKKAEAEAKKAELAAKKKAEAEAKKAEADAKKAEAEAKKAEEKAKKAELDAKKKAEAEAKKAAAAAAKKAEAEIKKAEEKAKKVELDAEKKATGEMMKEMVRKVVEDATKKAEEAAKKFALNAQKLTEKESSQTIASSNKKVNFETTKNIVDHDSSSSSGVDTEDDADITAIRKLTRDDTPDEENIPHHTNAVKVQKISIGSPVSSQDNTKGSRTSDTSMYKSGKTENRASRREEISGEIDSSNILPEKNRTKTVNVTVSSSSSESSSDSDSDDSSDSSDSEDETSRPTIVTAPAGKKLDKPATQSQPGVPKSILNESNSTSLKEPANIVTPNNLTPPSSSQSQSKLSALPSLSNLLDKKLPALKVKKKPIEKVPAKVAEVSSGSDSDSSSSDSSSSNSDSDSDSDSDSGSDSDSDSNGKNNHDTSGTNAKFMDAKSAKKLISKKSQKSKVKKNKGFSALMKDSKR